MPEAPFVASVALGVPSIEAAFHGLAGDVVRTIEPHSEADPRAILVQFLVAFGNVIGHKAYFQVEADQHHFNLFVLVAGETAKARKGVSLGQALRLFRRVFPEWVRNCRQSGLSSGEGVIWAVRDAGRTAAGPDPGVSDKRLLAVETEFASTLTAMDRSGNILSAVLRDAWDGSELQTLAKNSPARATDHHVSVVAHITREELLRHLRVTDKANGFMNRFLVIWVERSKKLPRGGSLSDADLAPFEERLRAAVEFARNAERIQFSDEAVLLWDVVYDELSEGYPGLVGAMLARAEAQVLRLAGIYALLDSRSVIGVLHLEAALAVWRYVEASVRYIFGESTGDSKADALLRELRSCGAAGMSKTEIRDYFQRHKPQEIDRALDLLEKLELVRRTSEATGGRPVSRWFATEATKAPEPAASGSGSEASGDYPHSEPVSAASGVPQP
jgi:hypothetical protein